MAQQYSSQSKYPTACNNNANNSSGARSTAPARGQQANQEKSYFNAHLEGMGYLNNIREVPTQNGSFISVQFCMLEGKPDDVEKVFISLTLPADDVRDLLTQHWDAINSQDDNLKVFAGLRISHLRAVPFTFGPNSQNAGQLGVNYSGRAIKVMHLKVGSQTIVLASEKREAKTDFGVPAKPAKYAAPVGKASAPVDHYPAGNEALFDKPLVVELRRDDPNFADIKARLSADGYRWHSDKFKWVVPQVNLDASSPYLGQQQEALEAEGYSSVDGVEFRMTFGQGAIPKKNQQNQHQGNNRGQSANSSPRKFYPNQH